jgi:transposase
VKTRPEVESEILRLHHAEGWPIGTIGRQMSVHASVVMRVLGQADVVPAVTMPRPSMVDPYLPFMRETLDAYPKLRASRLLQMVQERGYMGQCSRFREVVAAIRPRPKVEAFLRLATLPGEQGQVDWGHFGKVRVGKAERSLMAFVMVLSWSRMTYLRFFLDARMPNFLLGHELAFAAFGGVPRELLYDNLKSAVLERVGQAIRFNEKLLRMAGHYRLAPKPCAPYRGNEKGRVERRIRYIRDNFFAARKWRDLDDLNVQAAAWCDNIAASRPCPGDRSKTVREAFTEEQPRLLPLPATAFPCDEQVPVHVGKTPYVRFDLNDYSVPHTHVQRQLVVVADPQTVRVVDGPTVVATHVRTWGRDERVEDAAHIAALVAEKRAANQHSSTDRLQHAAPQSRDFLMRCADRGQNLGSITYQLSRLLGQYGAAELDVALADANARGIVHPPSVRQLLDQRRTEAGRPAALSAEVPQDPRLRDVVIHPHALGLYDQLQPPADKEDDHDGND